MESFTGWGKAIDWLQQIVTIKTTKGIKVIKTKITRFNLLIGRLFDSVFPWSSANFFFAGRLVSYFWGLGLDSGGKYRQTKLTFNYYLLTFCYADDLWLLELRFIYPRWVTQLQDLVHTTSHFYHNIGVITSLVRSKFPNREGMNAYICKHEYFQSSFNNTWI